MRVKKTIALVFCVALVLALAAPALANEVALPVSPQFTPTIDGVRDDGYSEMFTVNSFRAADGAYARMWSAWDDSNLFFFLEVTDTTPNHEHANAWERDSVEIFIDWNSARDATTGDADAFGNPYWQIRIKSAPQAAGTEAVTGYARLGDFDAIDFVVVPLVGNDLAGGYIIEVAMPRPADAITLEAGATIYVDFQVGDNQFGAARDSQAFLAGTDPDVDNQWQWPHAVRGIMTLGAAAAPAVPEEPAPPADEPEAAAVVADPGPAPAVTAARAPATFDPITVIALGALAAGAGAVIIKKRK